MGRNVFAIACAAAICAGPALAQDMDANAYDGDWMVRLRAIGVLPDESLKADGIPGADASISNQVVPELDFTYFFTPNIAAELILATARHNVNGRGALAGANIGSVWLLPPTLTAQYHFTQLADWTGVESLSKVKPYLGAGINYTIFYNEDAGQFNSIKYDNAFGWALQAGVDYEVGGGFYVNADVKYIFLNTDWEINNGAVRGSVDINPFIVGVGVGYRF